MTQLWNIHPSTYVYRITAQAYDATHFAIQLIQEHNIETLIVIGGDGTILEVANGIWRCLTLGLTCVLGVISVKSIRTREAHLLSHDVQGVLGIPAIRHSKLNEITIITADVIRIQRDAYPPSCKPLIALSGFLFIAACSGSQYSMMCVSLPLSIDLYIQYKCPLYVCLQLYDR